ncbi:unnamed protein product [Medioppia subpectinata]|uniref:Cytochrome P450 n=1 Tax=Medioppia subpectinata TaxID=1979941 RepID=A0A7R9KR78_9ACAR|nr:unnamed protein product [Medioppia subpectinata]CAG2107875.1 unnamed protein product [Medioppia subpectinata]
MCMKMHVTLLAFIFVFILSSIQTIRVYYRRKFRYWIERGINGPKPRLLLGTLYEQLKTPLPILEIQWYEKYGKLYGIYNGSKPTLIVGQPDLIKTILVKDFHNFTDRMVLKTKHPILDKHLVNARGDDWKRIRAVVSPTFSSGKIRRMEALVSACVHTFAGVLETYAQTGQTVNIKDLFGNFTMDVIASCAFATKTDTHNDPLNPFVTNARKIFNVELKKALPSLLLPTFVLKLLKIRSIHNEKANEFFFDTTRHILNKRRNADNSSDKYNDFLQLLINANNSETIDENDDTNDETTEVETNLIEDKTGKTGTTNRHLSTDEMLAQAYVFFAAGYETTANVLSFCAYELALNPEIQQKLFVELAGVGHESDGHQEWSYEELAKLPLLDAIVSETLRLHSPFTRLTRVSNTEYKLGDKQIPIKKGHSIDIPIYAMHHSDEYFPNANQFIAERFLPENRHKIIPYTYLPFGSGPRNCIGMKFALMETKLCLAQIVSRFKLIKCVDTETLHYKRITRLSTPDKVVVQLEMR